MACAGVCGGDPDRIEETIDLNRYAAFQSYWSEVAPPLNITFAAYAGFKPRPKATPQDFDQMDDAEFERELQKMAQMMGG